MTQPPDPGQPPYPPPWYGPPPGPYPPGYGYPVPAAPSTNGFAIASMVLGIVWVYWIGSVLALVFGYIALKQIRERSQSGKGMAIAGVVLGWVGVAFIPIMIIFVFAVGSAVKGEFHDTCEQFPHDSSSSSYSCR
jgi:hypothetical protein